LTASQQSAIVLSMAKLKQENGTMLKLTVRLPESLVEKAKIRAVKERTTLQDMVTLALETYLKTPLKREGVGR
jgi:predicted DNA binding CopG/RHH family protein